MGIVGAFCASSADGLGCQLFGGTTATYLLQCSGCGVDDVFRTAWMPYVLHYAPEG